MKKIFSLVCALAMVLSVSAEKLNVTYKAASTQKIELQASRVNKSLRRAPKALADVTPVSGTYYTVGGAYYLYYYSDFVDATSYMPSVEVEFNGNDVTITGLAYWFEEGAIHGTLSGNTITCASGQLVGADEYGNEYLVGSNDGENICDIVFTYDDAAQSLTAVTSIIAESESTTSLSVYGYWYEPVFSAKIPEAPAGGTFVADGIDFYSNGDTCQFVLTDAADSLVFYFCFPLADLVSGQTYTESDIIARYSGGVFNNLVEIDIVTLSFVKTVAANGSYTITATFVDANGATWNVSAAWVVSENVISMNYTAADRVLNVTTTNSDSYFFYIETQASYDAYQTSLDQAALNDEADGMIELYAYFEALDEVVFTGNQQISIEEYLDTRAATDDYIALAAPISGEKRNGATVYLQFHFDYPEAIENTADGVKAVKELRNGQLIIIKNGVEFNAQGAVLK